MGAAVRDDRRAHPARPARRQLRRERLDRPPAPGSATSITRQRMLAYSCGITRAGPSTVARSGRITGRR